MKGLLRLSRLGLLPLRVILWPGQETADALLDALLILVAGLSATQSLSVRQYPLSENAAVQITTAYVGASAELVVDRCAGSGFPLAPLANTIVAMRRGFLVRSASASLGDRL